MMNKMLENRLDEDQQKKQQKIMAHMALLDRDGTIIVHKEYIKSPGEVQLIPGAGEGIRLFRKLGLIVAVTSNQSGIGRGYFGLDDLELVDKRMEKLLADNGAFLDAIYFCPHHPDYGCECRKPAPGLALKAALDFGINLNHSFVIGDNFSDIEFGQRIGATTILVRTGYGVSIEAEGIYQPDHVVDNLLDAARLIEGLIS
jgi:D-glycero-D-manno-heptose 1,7-bisphosphate phosphatase